MFRLTARNLRPSISRASDAIKAGATRETLASQMKTDDLGWQFNPQFYGQLYDELAKK